MKTSYADSTGLVDVPGDSPVEAPPNAALAVFRGLHPRNGFMGIILDPQFTVQFAPQKRGGIRVELLDTSKPAFDACVADVAFAESLIQAAAEGQDVFQIARAARMSGSTPTSDLRPPTRNRNLILHCSAIPPAARNEIRSPFSELVAII